MDRFINLLIRGGSTKCIKFGDFEEETPETFTFTFRDNTSEGGTGILSFETDGYYSGSNPFTWSGSYASIRIEFENSNEDSAFTFSLTALNCTVVNDDTGYSVGSSFTLGPQENIILLVRTTGNASVDIDD